MIKIETSILYKLNQIYNDLLHRTVDEAGVMAYADQIRRGEESKVRHTIKKSQEYNELNNQKIKSKNMSLDSMRGDRKTHFSDHDTIEIDNNKYGNILNQLINLLIDTVGSKISTKNIKLSILHSIKNSKKITIFPHKEYYFNTENFLDSLKDFDNFRYFLIFLAILNVIKGITNKMVATCGTQNRLDLLCQKDIYSFNELFKVLNTYILNYLSIRITGYELNDNELNKLSQYIISKNSRSAIEFLQNKNSLFETQEQKTISQYLSVLQNKPKVLVHIAYLENQEPYLLQKMLDNAYAISAANPLIDVDLYFENDRIEKKSTDYTPWSRVKRIRNLMLSRTNLSQYDYLYIIDSDIVSYPHNFLSRAIGLNPNGITAPVMLIENSNVFYDWCGYQKKDHTSINSPYKRDILNRGCATRNFNLNPPYVNTEDRLVEIDCVGCTYVVPTSVFGGGYNNLTQELLQIFNLVNIKDHKIGQNIVQYEDHPTFTDHYTVCTALRSQGGKVYMDRGSVAYHADLPIYGENWH